MAGPAQPGQPRPAVPLTYEPFRYAFANAMTEEEANRLHETFSVSKNRTTWSATRRDFTSTRFVSQSDSMDSIEECSATLSRVVTAEDTAAGWGSDFPPAASTPFVLGLSEVACHTAVAEELAAEELTVGTGATIDHLAASPIGAVLVARARLVGRDGRRLSFEVEVYDGDVLAARVSHARAIVERSKLTARLERP